MKPADIIKLLEATTKRTEKEAIIKQAWAAGCTEFFVGARMAYDALVSFGVKKVPLIEGEDDPNFTSTFTWDKFVDIANKLEHRELTGNSARDVLRSAANVASVEDWNLWYRRILLKDLKCGITEATVNKVLEKEGAKAKDYIVPVFSCQLAKNGEDLPHKMVGKKLVDVKLDGIRLLTVLDVEMGTVVQYTRDGRENNRFTSITDSLKALLPKLKQSIVLDGECISKSFQELMKQVNRKENVNTSDAKLALFDIVPLADFHAGGCEMSQTQRHELLVGFIPLLEEITHGTVYVIPKMLIDMDTAEGQVQLNEFNKETIAAGYEGILLKDPNASYNTKRTESWLKIKPFISVDLEIIGVEPGKPESKFANTLGGLVCRGVDQGKNIEVTVGGGFTDELRDQIWANRSKVLGRVVEIKGDALTKAQDSDVWSLRFPVFLQFRGFNPHEKI